jgi:WhiB family redox-sensing transcriptional regulator
MDPAVFFPSDSTGVQAAQRICFDCPVRVPCLEQALADGMSHGVWGGTSERERRRIIRQRRMSRLEPVHR